MLLLIGDTRRIIGNNGKVEKRKLITYFFVVRVNGVLLVVVPLIEAVMTGLILMTITMYSKTVPAKTTRWLMLVKRRENADLLLEANVDNVRDLNQCKT